MQSYRSTSNRRQARSAALTALALAFSFAVAPGSAHAATASADQVRTIPAADIALKNPTSLAFSSHEGALLVGQTSRGRTTLRSLLLGSDRSSRSIRLPRLLQPSTLTYNASAQRVLAISRDRVLTAAVGRRSPSRPAVRRLSTRRLRLRDPRGAALSADGRTLYVLDNAARAILRIPVGSKGLGTAKRMKLTGVRRQRMRGLALNPVDGLLYTIGIDRDVVIGFDQRGAAQQTIDLELLHLRAPRALAFAPTADHTDHPARLSLYLADGSTRGLRGRIVEARLRSLSLASRLAAAQVTATMVQLIHTSRFSPVSPDPAGITYMPDRDRLLMSDSEVNEMTSWAGVNVWTLGRTGSATASGSTTAYSREPTGLGYNPADRTMFVADDDGDRISIVKPGPDGIHGNADDSWTRFSVNAYGITDAEGIEYDTDNGKLWICDGVGTEVYSIDPVNGIFGDTGDVVSNFDIGQFGARDCEGIGIDPLRGTLIAVDPSTRKVYETTKAGALLRTIDVSNVPSTPRAYSGIVMAPTSDSSDDPAALSYWVTDRAVDNGADPNENDGKIYEFVIESTDALPSVAMVEPVAGATVAGTVALRANATDDDGVTAVQFTVDGVVVGTDTNGADGWSASWDSTQASDGAHTISATAQDTAGQTRTATVDVTSANSRPDTTAPKVAMVAPSAGSSVTGTVAVAADASDDVAVASVRFLAGDTLVATDTDPADGWAVGWNTTTFRNGSVTLTAVATDTAGNSQTSAPVEVTVANAIVPVSLSVPVATGVDDADETLKDGAVRRTNGDVELGSEQTGLITVAGLRFAGVTIPPGARITGASVQFTADEKNRHPASLTVQGQAADTAPVFTSAAFSLSSRARTAAAVSWKPPSWLSFGAATATERTPDLSAVVQEIVGRPGWASGNALAILVRGSGRRTAESFEGGAPAVLRVEYTG